VVHCDACKRCTQYAYGETVPWWQGYVQLLGCCFCNVRSAVPLPALAAVQREAQSVLEISVCTERRGSDAAGVSGKHFTQRAGGCGGVAICRVMHPLLCLSQLIRTFTRSE
jgi:hypothetical protein